MDRKPILTLSAIAPEHPTIAIVAMVSGQQKLLEYELALQDEFGLRDVAEMRHFMSSVLKVSRDIESATEEDFAKVESDMDSFLSKILKGITAEVLAQLTLKQKTTIVEAFRTAVPTPPRTATKEETTAENEGSTTGDSPAPDSSDSTEGTPSDGTSSLSGS